MARQGSTAEHELLKTIEKGEMPGGSAASGSALPGGDPVWFGFFSSFDKWIKSLSDADLREFFKADVLKKVLKALVVIFGSIYVFVVLRGLVSLQNIPSFELAGTKEPPARTELDLPVRGLGFYLSNLVERNIFKAEEIIAEEPEEVVVEPVRKVSISERAKDLKLVGIAWSENEEERYAMIEDMSTQLTYYVREKERFLDFSIEGIEQQHVTIESRGEELKLR